MAGRVVAGQIEGDRGHSIWRRVVAAQLRFALLRVQQLDVYGDHRVNCFACRIRDGDVHLNLPAAPRRVGSGDGDLGDWAIRFLLAALAITPIRGITGWAGAQRFRRMIGLFAFFYVCLHLSSYIGLDQFFDWVEIWKDITKRNYITVGMVNFVLLVPLAATSTNAMVKRLGGKRWARLHKLVYGTGILACIHFYMMRKGVQLEPIIYAGICAVLLGYRVVTHLKKKARIPKPAQ